MLIKQNANIVFCKRWEYFIEFYKPFLFQQGKEVGFAVFNRGDVVDGIIQKYHLVLEVGFDPFLWFTNKEVLFQLSVLDITVVLKPSLNKNLLVLLESGRDIIVIHYLPIYLLLYNQLLNYLLNTLVLNRVFL